MVSFFYLKDTKASLNYRFEHWAAADQVAAGEGGSLTWILVFSNRIPPATIKPPPSQVNGCGISFQKK